MFCLSVLSHFWSFSLPCTRSSHSSLPQRDRTVARLVWFPLYLLCLFFFPPQFLGFWLLLLHHSYNSRRSVLWLCSLCQESGAGGCFKCFFARSEATCLWHLSLSLAVFLLLTSLSSCLLWLGSVGQNRHDHACLFWQGIERWAICVLQHLKLSHYASQVAYLALRVCHSFCTVNNASAALKTVSAYLIIPECFLCHFLSAVCSPLLSCVWMSVRLYASLCPLGFSKKGSPIPRDL